MNLTVTNDAAKWYEQELAIESPGFVRFFPRYGFGGHIPGFAIGINQEKPNNIYTQTKVNDITFYIEQDDAWYFEDLQEMKITYNEKMDEPEIQPIEK